jgi:hypothetical protein
MLGTLAQTDKLDGVEGLVHHVPRLQHNSGKGNKRFQKEPLIFQFEF